MFFFVAAESSLCVLVNPLLNCTLRNAAKKFGLITDQLVCDRVVMGNPVWDRGPLLEVAVHIVAETVTQPYFGFCCL
jgi:hypothetical protein